MTWRPRTPTRFKRFHQAVRKLPVQSWSCRTAPALRAASTAEQAAQAEAQVREAVAVVAVQVVEAAVEVAAVVGVGGAAQAADVSWFIHFIGESS